MEQHFVGHDTALREIGPVFAGGKEDSDIALGLERWG
jgi:hypothetical protein